MSTNITVGQIVEWTPTRAQAARGAKPAIATVVKVFATRLHLQGVHGKYTTKLTQVRQLTVAELEGR